MKRSESSILETRATMTPREESSSKVQNDSLFPDMNSYAMVHINSRAKLKLMKKKNSAFALGKQLNSNLSVMMKSS